LGSGFALCVTVSVVAQIWGVVGLCRNAPALVSLPRLNA